MYIFNTRDKFPFFIVQIPHLLSNIPSKIFCGSIFLELLRIARCTLRTNDFIPKVSDFDLFSRMIAERGNIGTLTKQLRIIIH